MRTRWNINQGTVGITHYALTLCAIHVCDFNLSKLLEIVNWFFLGLISKVEQMDNSISLIFLMI